MTKYLLKTIKLKNISNNPPNQLKEEKFGTYTLETICTLKSNNVVKYLPFLLTILDN